MLLTQRHVMSSCRYMPFVKLDCKMLDSSLWPEKDQRDLFITALLMAEPIEIKVETPQLKVRSLDETGFSAPPGWYGFIPAAGIGIINRCGMSQETGLSALERLGEPDPESRSNDFEGRRLIRIDGGYLALNYDKYRERDYSNAERCKRYREKKKNKDMACQGLQHACQHESDMQAEAEAEAEVKKKKEAFKIPLTLQTDDFLKKWGEWLIHRSEIKKKMTSSTAKKQLDQLESWGVEKSIKSIDESIKQGWSGLFEPKNFQSSKSKIRSSSEYSEALKEQGLI